MIKQAKTLSSQHEMELEDRQREIERLKKLIESRKNDIDKYAQRDIATEKALTFEIEQESSFQDLLR